MMYNNIYYGECCLFFNDGGIKMKKTLKKCLSVILCAAMIFSLCGMLSFAEGADGKEPFRISVAMNGNAGTQRGFCWYTNESTGTEVQVYRLSDGVAVNAAVLNKVTEEWNGNYMHKATVSGLNPGETYGFRVGDGTVWSEEGSFVTDNGDDSFSFITIADVQAGSLENFESAANVVSAAFENDPEAEFLVNCGDFTNDSDNEQWDYYDAAFGDINMTYTIAPVTGNHDGFGAANWFNNMFNLDTSESVQTKNGVNYSFDYGNAHIAVLNTNDSIAITLTQLKWLKNDMNSTDKDWKIVFMHKTPYTLGKDGKWPDAMFLQRALVAVIDECDVDLVMSGHDHQYLRTKPLKGGKPAEGGATYVLSGTAGTKRYEVREFLADHFLDTDNIAALTIQKNGYANYWNGSDWNSTDENRVGGCFNSISIEGGTLTLKSYIVKDLQKDENGNVIEGQQNTVTQIDEFSVTKETGKNKATFSGDNTTSEVEYYLGVVPSFLCLAAYTFGEWLPKFLIMLPKLIAVYIKDGTF